MDQKKEILQMRDGMEENIKMGEKAVKELEKDISHKSDVRIAAFSLILGSLLALSISFFVYFLTRILEPFLSKLILNIIFLIISGAATAFLFYNLFKSTKNLEMEINEGKKSLKRLEEVLQKSYSLIKRVNELLK